MVQIIRRCNGIYTDRRYIKFQSACFLIQFPLCRICYAFLILPMTSGYLPRISVLSRIRLSVSVIPNSLNPIKMTFFISGIVMVCLPDISGISFARYHFHWHNIYDRIPGTPFHKTIAGYLCQASAFSRYSSVDFYLQTPVPCFP